MDKIIANKYKVITLDLGMARDNVALVVFGHKLVVFRATGTFDIRFSRIENDPIRITALTYPSQIVFDDLEFNEVYITNTAQTGQIAELIVFWREEEKK